MSNERFYLKSSNVRILHESVQRALIQFNETAELQKELSKLKRVIELKRREVKEKSTELQELKQKTKDLESKTSLKLKSIKRFTTMESKSSPFIDCANLSIALSQRQQKLIQDLFKMHSFNMLPEKQEYYQILNLLVPPTISALPTEHFNSLFGCVVNFIAILARLSNVKLPFRMRFFSCHSSIVGFGDQMYC